MSVLSWAAPAALAALVALMILLAVWRDRAHRRRIARYSATELADLTRGDIDPGWEHTRRAVAELDDDLGPDGGEAA